MANYTIDKFTFNGNTYVLEDSAAQSALTGKQDTLVSGTNIKTVNNNSLLGSGNITIESGVSTTFYGNCNTTASTAEKVVICDGFELTKGAIIGIYFSTGNTASVPTLNINSTGAKSIYVGRAVTNPDTNVLKWSNYTMLYFIYDGSYYRYITSVSDGSVVPPRGANTWTGTCTTAATDGTKVVTSPNFLPNIGALIQVQFDNANTYTGNLQLNIDSTGAKYIYVGDNKVSATNPLFWDAQDTVTFICRGNYYSVVSKYPISMALSATDDGAGNVTLNMSNVSAANGGSF